MMFIKLMNKRYLNSSLIKTIYIIASSKGSYIVSVEDKNQINHEIKCFETFEEADVFLHLVLESLSD